MIEIGQKPSFAVFFRTGELNILFDVYGIILSWAIHYWENCDVWPKSIVMQKMCNSLNLKRWNLDIAILLSFIKTTICEN